MKHEEVLEQISYLRELTERTRLRAAHRYNDFFVWGLVWIVGYISTLWYSYWIIWPVIISAGYFATFFMKKGRNGISQLEKQLISVMVVFNVSSLAIFLILLTRTTDILLFNAYWPFQIGVLYIVFGIFIGREYVVIGCWLLISAVASLFLTLMLQHIWLAIASGGGLLTTGLILRKQVMHSEQFRGVQ